MDQLEFMLPLAAPNFRWSTSLPNSSSDSNDSLMIYGSHPQIKTNLLFQAAVSHISQGSHVTFICSEPLPQLPLHVHAMPQPEPQLMAMLKMMYITNYSDLVKYLASIHSLPVLPEVLILDDLTGFTAGIQNEASQVHATARLCALLEDALHFLHASKQGTGKIYTSACSNPEMVNSVYGKFFSNIAAIESAVASEAGPEVPKSDHFVLTLQRRCKTAKVKYRCHITLDSECLRLTKVQSSEPPQT